MEKRAKYSRIIACQLWERVRSIGRFERVKFSGSKKYILKKIIWRIKQIKGTKLKEEIVKRN